MEASESVWIDPDVSPSAACHFEAARRAVPMLSRPELERQLIHSLAAQVNHAQALKRLTGRLIELEATVAAMERPAPQGGLDDLADANLGTAAWNSHRQSDEPTISLDQVMRSLDGD